MTVILKNLRRWCALTHSAWKDEEGHVLPYHCVQKAHVVDRALPRKEKARLEVAWGLKPGQFPFDGPLNTIPLSADWHARFDRNDFALLPSLVTLATIADAQDQYLRTNGARKAADMSCPLLTKGNKLDYKIHRYVIVPFDPSNDKPRLLRMHFQDGQEWEQLGKAYTLYEYEPNHLDDWPVIESTVHPFAMIWKAVSEFGVDNSDHTLLAEGQVLRMATAQQIYKRWMKYADDHPNLLSAKFPDPGPSPPSNPGSGRQTRSSDLKRRRSDDDEGGDDCRPPKRSAPSGCARDTLDVIDEIPSMLASPEDDRPGPHSDLQSPSLVDHSVRVAKDEDSDDDDDDDDDEYRPSFLQPMRKFNIAEWAKRVSIEGEAVIETECLCNPAVSEEPRKPPRGAWKRWRPAYV